jgi:hypothetical protein
MMDSFRFFTEVPGFVKCESVKLVNQHVSVCRYLYKHLFSAKQRTGIAQAKFLSPLAGEKIICYGI